MAVVPLPRPIYFGLADDANRLDRSGRGRRAALRVALATARTGDDVVSAFTAAFRDACAHSKAIGSEVDLGEMRFTG